MRFTISVSGDVQLDRDIEAVGEHVANLNTVLRDIARDLDNESRLQFATQGVHASGGWPPLTEAYRKRKAQMVASGKIIHGRPARYMQILRLTDRMRMSLVDRHNPEHIERIHGGTLEWGSRVPYVRFHQTPGTSARAMPRRRVLELSEKKRQQYMRALLTFIRTGKSGL